MALSNWDTLAVNEKGESTNGVFVSPQGVSVEIYKNQLWVNLGDRKDQITFDQGDMAIRDTSISVKRGPQEGVFCITYAPQYKPTQAMVGCGVYGYTVQDKPSEEWEAEFVGVTEESVKFLQDMILEKLFTEEQARKDVDYFLIQMPPHMQISDKEKDKKVQELLKDYRWPEIIRQIDLSKAVRFNQGDAYFADKVEAETPATPVGEADGTIMSDLLKKG